MRSPLSYPEFKEMKLYILGNGAHAYELFDQLILEKNKYDFQGFIIIKDDKAFVISSAGIIPFTYESDAAFVLGTIDSVQRNEFIKHFTRVYEPSKQHFPNVYSPKAHLSPTAILGIGNIFLAFSCVTGIATIGDFNLFNTYSSIHSNSKIADYNILHSYAGIMNNCLIGSSNILHPNCVVTDRITIGNDNVISSGECVFDNIHDKELFQSGIILKKPKE